MREVLDRHPAGRRVRARGDRARRHRVRERAIRGGTDGSRLSFMGLPTPNIFAGEQNFHSRLEWVSVQDMEKAVEVIVQLAGSGRNAHETRNRLPPFSRGALQCMRRETGRAPRRRPAHRRHSKGMDARALEARAHRRARRPRPSTRKAGVPVEVLWKAPIREDDREQQVQVVEGFVGQRVSGLVLAPLDSHALMRPVEEAAEAGILTVIFDSALADPSKAVSYVSTDNKRVAGSPLAHRRGAEWQRDGPHAAVQEGSAATEERERGFLEELKAKFPDVTVISSDQYAGATRDTAKRTSENLLNRYADKVSGIFTPNESSTAGMLLALQDIDKAGAINFVGFDYSSAFVEPLRKGELKGFVVQNPVNMGYSA